MRFIFIFWFGFILGAVGHELDLARNFTETGDAKAWVKDIRCTGVEP